MRDAFEAGDLRLPALLEAARYGCLDRRRLLEIGLRLGLATPAITALLAAAPGGASAAPAAVDNTQRWLRQAGDSGTFTILIGGGTSDIDPHSSYSTLGSAICFGVYEMLLKYKGASTDEYEPMLAESWEASPDNSTFTFTLAPKIMFHDGTPCDAEAVKASFTRFLELELGPVNVISRFVESPDQIEVVDPTTVRFNLGTSQPLFLAAMASSYGPYVVSPTAVEEHKTEDDPYAHEWFINNAVGTGPYTISEFEAAERIVLQRFPDYHREGENPFDQIIFRVVEETATRRQLMEQGEADATTYNLTAEDVEALQTNPDVRVEVYDTTRANWTIMNAVRMKTPEVRRGFSYAFPYQEVIDGVYKGFIKRGGPITDNVRGYDPNVFLYQTDLNQAKELILSGGFKEGDSFDYAIDASDEIQRAAALVFQASLAEIGFGLEIQALDTATLEDVVFGDAPAEQRPMFIAWAWWPDYNDAWNQLAPNFLESATGGGGSNAGYWVNTRFEELMAEAETVADEARYTELMAEAQAILTEQDPPSIYHGQVKYYTVLQQAIQGFVPNPLYLESYPLGRMSRSA